MDYQDTLGWLFGLETMGIKLGLQNITELLHRMGDPQEQFRSVHVAGSNGKGSVSAMTESILRHQGYRAGLYTSPHLVDFRERIQINGVVIPEETLCRLVEELRGHVEDMNLVSKESHPTFFEVTTALAFSHFAESGVEVAAVEVGMGGRLDATNVISPDCTIITRISLEHTKYLGNNLVQIAGEKAGIIKSGVSVITAESSESEAFSVIAEAAKEKGCPVRVVGQDIQWRLIGSSLQGTLMSIGDIGEVRLPLLGSFQGANAAMAYGAARELNRRGLEIEDDAIARGLSNVRWPGRLEIVGTMPHVVFDVSHTPDGAKAVAEDLDRLFSQKVVLILGVLDDKDLDGIAGHFGRISKCAIATAPATPRAYPAERVAESLRGHVPKVVVELSVVEALRKGLAKASVDDVLLVTGSLYTVGEAKAWWDLREAR